MANRLILYNKYTRYFRLAPYLHKHCGTVVFHCLFSMHSKNSHVSFPSVRNPSSHVTNTTSPTFISVLDKLLENGAIREGHCSTEKSIQRC